VAFSLLQVENGVGLPTAIVYAPTGTTDPLAPAIAYLVLAGRTAFLNASGNVTGTSVPKQEAFLVQATRFVETLGRVRIRGIKTNPVQGLLFPRFDLDTVDRVLDSNEIPLGWLAAIWEAAELVAQGEPLNAVVDVKSNIKVDQTGKSLKTEYFPGGPGARRGYPMVTDLMEPYLEARGLVRG
jgi:hypothetical protein